MRQTWPKLPAGPGGTTIAHDFLALLPAGALTAYWAISAAFSGAYFPSSWYPVAIAVVAICPLLLAAGWRLPVGGTRTSLLLLGGFVLWTALSIGWAAAGGHALEATNKLLLPLASAFIFAITPWNERRALAVLCLLAVGVAAASVATLLSTAYSSNPASSFIEQRYAAPLGYAGGSAVFAALAVWPALGISARAQSPVWMRASFFALAVVQIELALLPQSRGVMIALGVSALGFVLLAPSRLGTLMRILVAAGICALTIGPVLHVYTVANGGGSVVDALHRAVGSIALAALIAFFAGLLLAIVDARLPRETLGRTPRRVGAALLGTCLAVAVLLGVPFSGSLTHAVSDRWDAFKAGHVERSESVSHLTSLGDPERYDYWRVALAAFDEKPIDGIGAGNFQDAYTVKRESAKHSRYAHSIWMRVLSETGAVGLALLLGALGVGIFTVAKLRRNASTSRRLLLASALPVTLLVFSHASVDWVEEFPPILSAGLCLLFLSGRLVNQPPPGPPQHQGAGMFTGLVIAGVMLAGLVPAYLSLRFTDRAASEAPTNVSAAYRDLDRAAYLNPLSSAPDLLRGEIAAARGEDGLAIRAFEKAIEREDNWYPHFQLATLDSENGRGLDAIHQMAKAQRLNPVDPLLEDAARRLEEEERLTVTGIRDQIQEEAARRFFHLHQPAQKQR